MVCHFQWLYAIEVPILSVCLFRFSSTKLHPLTLCHEAARPPNPTIGLGHNDTKLHEFAQELAVETCHTTWVIASFSSQKNPLTQLYLVVCTTKETLS